MISPELALRMIRESPVIVLDTETSGLTVKDHICGWVVTDKDNSVYVPVRHKGGGNIPDVEGFEAALAQGFLDRTRCGLRTVGHHLGFDLRAALRHGIRILGPLEDTMVNEALINDLTIGYSLEETAKRYNVQAKKGADLYAEMARRFGGMPDAKQMRHFHEMEGDHPLVVEYSTGDGTSTLQVWHAQQGMLDSDGLRRVWQLECDLLPYLARMHHRGLKVNAEYAANIGTHIEREIAEASKVFAKGFNVRSPNDVEGLYRRNGFCDADFARTDSGKVSFTEKWLEDNEIGQQILGVRKLQKARDSFIAPLIDTQNINGRVHPVLNQSKSDTFGVAGARLSCTEPNMQAFPKRDKTVGKVVRKLIVPDDGYWLEEADFRQQEPRLFTHYSGQPELLEGYRNGTMDMHDRASAILGIPRDTAKRLSMGMLTMMSVPTLAVHMGWPLEDARAAHRAFLSDAFPMIGEFQQLAISRFREKGYVKSIMGRRAYMDEYRFGYRAVSRVIQNSGGDHCKLALLRACQYEDAYPEVQILLSIHDSIMWQRQPWFDHGGLVAVIEHTAEELELKVPIPVDVGTGLDWAEVSYGK